MFILSSWLAELDLQMLQMLVIPTTNWTGCNEGYTNVIKENTQPEIDSERNPFGF